MIKNIAIVLSGGVGERFGSIIPKQYLKINDKACIDYVFEAIEDSKKIDKTVTVIDKKYIKYSKILENNKNIDIVAGGVDRYDSINNAFQYIAKTYKDCENIIILQAVSPLIYPKLVDEYVDLLKDYDCVITSRKLTGELGEFSDHDKIFNRNEYYLMESPESYRFSKIYKSFDPKFKSSELAYQLPNNSKKFLYFDFPENIKITYPHDLEFCKALINNKKDENKL